MDHDVLSRRYRWTMLYYHEDTDGPCCTITKRRTGTRCPVMLVTIRHGTVNNTGDSQLCCAIMCEASLSTRTVDCQDIMPFQGQ